MKLKTKEKYLFYIAIAALAIIVIVSIVSGRDRVATFEDENLEAVIREVINFHSDEDIMRSQLEGIKVLDARESEIHSLVGIEYLSGLEELYLRRNQITEIEPLKNLTTLRKLDLRENYIIDLEPLGYLRQLTHLNLRENLVSDITPLNELIDMRELNLRDNQIQDITPLGKMTKLRDVNLRNNMIEDVSVLLRLTNLRQRIYLEGNQIRDFRIFERIYDQIEEKDFELRVVSPFFSHKGGFYTKEFSLTLYTYDEDDRVYYTLDGSVPDPINNPDRTFLYKDPINIGSRAGEPNNLSMISEVSPAYVPPKGDVFKGTVVRAVLYNGDDVSRVSTETYFVDPNKSYTLPVISIVTDEENLFDYDKGIYVKGRIYDENYDPDITWETRDANYKQSGPEWERPAHIEFFEPDGSLGFAQNIGIRVHGGWTTAWSQKSLRIFARNEYDEQDIINHEVFPGLTKPGTDMPLSQFKRLILRNSGNDWPYTLFRDALMQGLMEDTFLTDTQAYRPAIVFINGEYWGIQNIRERHDHHYFDLKYGVDTDDIVVLSRNARLDRGEPGDENHYNDMINFVKENDMSIEKNYNYIKTLIDIENYIDYQAAEIYYANSDWPGNNIRFWRKRTDGYEPDAPYGHDGRWRWAMYDVDFGFGLPGSNEGYSHNTLALATEENGPSWPNPDWSTLLFRSLLENEEFSNQFINRFSDLLNSNFTQENVTNLINEYQSTLEPEIEEHINRRGSGWGNLGGSKGDWIWHVDVLREFAKNRPDYIRKHINEHFNLRGSSNITLNTKGSGYIKVNTLNIEGPWEGIYFKDIPVTIEAIPKEGYRFKGWEEDLLGDSRQTIFLTKDIKATAVFERE